ncbi:ABC transporter ATP-binding protein [Vreelandella populi]|uniref:ABC transporter ATP-binding protein n=1 Tax=Vreelandella populi TaxID=2498858 RepID=UPI000F8D9E39|nr:ABC transporter ATP-binding protein [Halomonas populi]RUR42374.1 ABC transporter ATP-binding protein [Halomonas populi]RUR57999.1 ABC transporter ATP-binding protein [Halomonas populi]
MSSNETIIRVDNIHKYYQVYDKPNDRLKQFIVPRFKKLIGQEGAKYFKEFKALNNVSFEVKKGETVGIIGRNGSGKSTLLQMICGTLTPTQGEIETRGRIAALLELGSGFNPEFTGRENVYMNATVLGLTTEEVNDRFDSIVEFADIGDFIDQPIKTYSSGMAVRLAFAVIAHVDADILVIDEALSVGDAFFVQKCMRFLRKFMENGTVLFVSHDTGAIINLCQRVVWLDKGEIKMIGEPKDISKEYLAAMYISQQDGTAPMSATNKNRSTVGLEQNSEPEDAKDMRLDFINTTQYRNDIEIIKFDENSEGFGSGGAVINSAHLLDENGERLAWVVGGENVTVRIECTSNTYMTSPIVGFLVKDRLGQHLFGDNTYLTYLEEPVHIAEGEVFVANFQFRMPVLPMGDYSMTVAIAEGSQQGHVQHHWMHDAIVLKSHSSSVSTGLVGVPMKKIEMTSL